MIAKRGSLRNCPAPAALASEASARADGRSTTTKPGPLMTSPHPSSRSAPRRRPIASAVAAAALLLVLPIVAGCSKTSSNDTATASGSDPVVARVNGVDIKESDLVLAEEDVGSDIQA